MSSKEEILGNIQKWVRENLHDFSFRKHQLETVYTLINNIVNNQRETNIIEAPTGSGKSLICIITAGVLASSYEMTSYILCSDLYLWKQYADFITDNGLPFGKLMGSKGNYTCDQNGQDLSLSMCRLKGVAYKTLMNFETAEQAGFPCVRTCEYMRNRRRAVKADVTLMTYQLWLNYLNYTDHDTFGVRSVIFCDECHNIPGIIQLFCQPSISPKYNFPCIEDVVTYAIDNDYVIERPVYTSLPFSDEETRDGKPYISVAQAYTLQSVHRDMSDAFNAIYDTEDKSVILQKYSDYYRIVEAAAKMAKSITEYFSSKSKHKKPTKTEVKVIRNAQGVEEYARQLFDFMRAISICGEDCLMYLVKNNNVDKESNRSVSFACSREDLLCNEYLLKNAPYKVMLSATVGAHEAFNENVGVKYTRSKVSEMFRIPSTFDFSKSPIYYLPKLKMSKAYIEQNFPAMQSLIASIVSSPRHLHEKGIIHTGSYKNALRMYEMMPDDIRRRLYIYGSSKEKGDKLMDFEDSDDGILIGPTLTEGIDLPDDGCRFIIIMKIPYPNLGDNLVLSKVKLFPKWYNSETSNTVIQAIGRGNRTPTDWCTTYILDGSFGQLYAETRDQYAPELQRRMVLLNG